MTIRVTKTLSKLLAFCLITAMLWGTVCGYKAFLGPGLTDAAAAAIDLGTLTPTDVELQTPTDVVTPTNIVVSTNETMQTTVTAAQQVKNVLFVVDVARSDIQTASFHMYYASEDENGWVTDDLELYQFDYGSIDYRTGDETFTTSFSPNSGNVYGSITAERDFSANTRLLQVYFNGNQDAHTQTLLNCFDIGNVVATNDNGASITNAITMSVAVLGDLNEDNEMNAEDSLQVLQYSSNPVTHPLTANEKLSADVNQDSFIDDVDAELIMQYGVNTIGSFWEIEAERLSFPTTHTPDISPNVAYHIKNVTTGAYLRTQGISTSARLYATSNPGTQPPKFFLKPTTNGAYELSYIAYEDLPFKVDAMTRYPVTGADFILSDSEQWYFVPVDGGYRIMNKGLNPQNALSDYGYASSSLMSKCGFTSLAGADVWVLEPPETSINFYYDHCHQARAGSEAISSIVDDHPDIKNIIESLFGMNITMVMNNQPVTSYNDLCYEGTTITAQNVDDWCQHCNDDTACEDYSDESIPTSGTIHHNNGKANLNYLSLIDQFEGVSGIKVLITGHASCGQNAVGEAHRPDNKRGVSYIISKQAVIFDQRHDDNYYDQIVTLHEISHCLGAGGTTSSKADTFHGNCIMSYNANNSFLLTKWNSGNYEMLFCGPCKTEIQNYVNAHY